MISLQSLCDHLDDLLSSQKISDYCPNGLQVEGKRMVSRAATAVSASVATIEEAVKLQADVLIVHHGLFWKNDSYVIERSKREKLELLLEHGIALLAYHLPLDIHQEYGNNWKAAKDMGWTQLEPFGLYNGAPIGVKGKLPGLSRKEVQKRLEDYYQHEAHSALGGPEEIRTIGLVSGGAHKIVDEAAKEHLDAFVTGSFDEPVWHQATEDKINFYALGHSATERIGVMALQEYIQKQLHIPCSFIDIRNPF